MKNPYPEFLIDEVGGIEVKNIYHQIWEEGNKAGQEVKGGHNAYIGGFKAGEKQEREKWITWLNQHYEGSQEKRGFIVDMIEAIERRERRQIKQSSWWKG